MEESRAKAAAAMFEAGYSCAQSVFATYAQLLGMDRVTALKLSYPLGGGMGRMREVCGAVSAMAMLCGLKMGNTDPNDEAGREAPYAMVRRMADRLKEETGSILCRELLGLSGREDSAAPQKRTAAYYAERPCSRIVELAGNIVETELLPEIFGSR